MRTAEVSIVSRTARHRDGFSKKRRYLSCSLLQHCHKEARGSPSVSIWGYQLPGQYHCHKEARGSPSVFGGTSLPGKYHLFVSHSALITDGHQPPQYSNAISRMQKFIRLRLGNQSFLEFGGPLFHDRAAPLQARSR